MAKVVPSLDVVRKGGTTWVEDPLEVGNRLLQNYLSTDPHQSVRYAHTIASSVDIAATNDMSYREGSQLVSESLLKLFNSHFSNTVADVTIEEGERVIMTIDITWNVNGKSYGILKDDLDFSQVLERIINIHNTGDILTPSGIVT